MAVFFSLYLLIFMRNKTDELEQRADLISAAIVTISSEIQRIEATGVVAPPGCCVLRYQARGKERTYWYYKLQATEPIFPTPSGKMSKYKHLGKGGTTAHIDALMSVTRRTQIEALQRTLASLHQCWSDLYDNAGSSKQRTPLK
jgi:hypothetical protein